MATGCLISESTKALNNVSSMVARYHQAWMNADKYVREITNLTKEIYDYLQHQHRSHYHYWYGSKSHTGHAVRGTPPGISGECWRWRFPDACLRELFTREDIDYNGFVYGMDFILDSNEPEKPRSLVVAERNITAIYGIQLPYGRSVMNGGDPIPGETFIVSWDEFVEMGKIPQRPSATTLQGQLVQELILGQKKASGQCRNEIYGYTFKIDDDDPQKPRVLKNIEKSKNLPKVKTVLTWKQYLERCHPHLVKTDPKQKIISKEKKDECNYICTRLMTEWLYNIDIDKNGLIYGHTF